MRVYIDRRIIQIDYCEYESGSFIVPDVESVD
jgi:hypothetical protein